MKTVLIAASLFLATICGNYCAAQKIKEESKTGGAQKKGKDWHSSVNAGNIVLGNPTENTVTASVILGKDFEGYIEYATTAGKYENRTAIFRTENDDPVEIVISKLVAGTTYYYRLLYKRAGDKNFNVSPASWFATKRNSNTTFSFGVQGDSHPERQGKMFSPELYRRTIQLVSQQRPDFYFLMGDDFSLDRLLQNNTVTKENVEAVYKTQRYFLGSAGINPPLFLVNGNHEQAAKYFLNGSPDNAAVQAGLARKKFFPLPAPGVFYSGNRDTVQHIGLLKDYYSFEWGNALFVVIDPYWHSDVPVDNQPAKDGEEKKKKEPWGATLGKEQYDWLKKTLERSGATFKFVFAHHVNGTGRGGVERAKYFEWGGYGQNGQWQFDRYRPGWEMPVHQLFVKNKVTIFFQGHDHLFAKQELDGVIYQSVPCPADDTYTAFNKEAYTSGDVLPNSGFLNITVSPHEVGVEYRISYLEGSVPPGGEARENYTYTIKRDSQ